MRSTVRLDADLMEALKQRADREQTSMTKLLNRVVREWFAGAGNDVEKKKRVFQQKTYSMGKPLVDLTKALQLAAELEDE
jgi:hypothetical protein